MLSMSSFKNNNEKSFLDIVQNSHPHHNFLIIIGKTFQAGTISGAVNKEINAEKKLVALAHPCKSKIMPGVPKWPIGSENGSCISINFHFGDPSKQNVRESGKSQKEGLTSAEYQKVHNLL